MKPSRTGLRVVAAVSPRVRVQTLARSAQKREVLAVTVAAPGIKNDAPTVAVVCRQHGDEPVPTTAALRVIAEAVTTQSPARVALLGRVRLWIVPLANPDGAVSNSRFCDGTNANRDWGEWKLPATRAIWRELRARRPAALLDCHELLPGDYKTHPYIEQTGIGAPLSHRLAVAAGRDKSGELLVQVREPARDCPPSLLYIYFQRKLKRPAIMVESSSVQQTLGAREQLHQTAIWATAAWAAPQPKNTAAPANAAKISS